MCGLAGIYAPDGASLAEEPLEAMIGELAHRGPDGFGYLRRPGIALAHARLSIIDLQTGEQPIANEDRSIWVVLNGEIFNFIELRAELEARGHRFRTQSDTESIVHAYEEFGDAFVERLNGQFAIALWDGSRRRLLLARDRVGIRPLFYVDDGNRVLFASEIKALLPAMRSGLRISPEGLAQIFTLWSAVGAQTVFENVKSLPPGHLMILDRAGRTLRRYWDWSAPEDDGSASDFATSADELRERLRHAVRLQLRADVPVGAYLSGGLDSSAIAALIREVSTTPMRTFSVVFDDDEFDESKYQEAMVRFLGTEHTAVNCSSADIGAAFPDFVRHAETPVLRTAPVPLMILSGLVRQNGFKVVLTGEGADEVFGGYDLFKESKVRRFWAKQPSSKARPALLTRLYPYLKHSPVGNAAMAASFYGQRLAQTQDPFYAHIPRWTTTQRLWNFFSADLRARIEQDAPMRAVRELLPRNFASWHGLARDQYVEVQTLMSGYLLSSQGDRVAMANSVEGRFPFLDHHIIEFANSLPARFKIRGLMEKALLRRAVGNLLPPAIAGRRKQPYRAPDVRSFFTSGGPLDYVAELFSPERLKSAGYFDPAAVHRLFEKCRSGKAIGFSDNMAFVGILSTMLLDQQYMKSKRPRQ